MVHGGRVRKRGKVVVVVSGGRRKRRKSIGKRRDRDRREVECGAAVAGVQVRDEEK